MRSIHSRRGVSFKLRGRWAQSLALLGAALAILSAHPLFACTGITLRAKDGTVVFGRTMEWGTFDLKSRLVVVPRGYRLQAAVPDGDQGIAWTAKYGAVGLDALETDVLVDGMNEKGLAVNVFYHPGFAEYPPYDPAQAARSLGAQDLCEYLLTSCASTADVRQALAEVNVVGVSEPALGIAPPIHLMVTEPSGKAIVIEFTKHKTTIYDAPLGIITNAPNYDWHITNLRNYVNLSPVALPGRKIEDLNFAPLGGGSGMIGLPGDFTPPSRFVRATAFAASARPTPDGPETFYELFRILDNFNIPLGAAEGEGAAQIKGMRSSTNWTTGYDTKNLVLQYHTMHNRRVRQIDLKRIDFGRLKDVIRLPLDREKKQDLEDVTPVTR